MLDYFNKKTIIVTHPKDGILRAGGTVHRPTRNGDLASLSITEGEFAQMSKAVVREAEIIIGKVDYKITRLRRKSLRTGRLAVRFTW